MDPETVTSWSAAVQAFAALATLVVTVILVVITNGYVKLTKGILDETSKARLAAEHSASAAEASARAAFESVALMRQQIEEQAGLGKQIVQSTIDSAVSAVTYWIDHNIADWGVVRTMAPTENLFPQKAASALDHAARISPAGATVLSSAFDELRTCCADIEHLRAVATLPGAWLGAIQKTNETKLRLKTSLEKFSKAKSLLL
jgi:hypothetical protein